MSNSNIEKIINKIKEELLNEVTSTKVSRGSYNPPLRPGLRKWLKNSNNPYTQTLSNYVDAENYHDSLDGKMSKNNKNISKKEKKAKHIRDVDFKINSWDEGDDEYTKTPYKVTNVKPISEWIEITNDLLDEDIDRIINKIDEASESSIVAGPYTGPIELGMKKWSKSELGPFQEFVDKEYNHKKVKSTTKNNIKRKVGVWEKGKDGTYDIDTHPVHTINEDLAVWFGTKKKPKGSKQPKGPWVNICRKVDGKHPPCGRPEASDKGYPKCRAAGVASKMSDSQKKSACQQKRKAEKTHSKSGTGNKPKMTHYEPKNESLKDIVREVLREYKKSI